MTDLKKIKTPLMFCTKKEQVGLEALIGVPDALQVMGAKGDWYPRNGDDKLLKGCMYRQNPEWNPPKLDVPDWFWESTDYNYVAMDGYREVFAYKHKPCNGRDAWAAFGIRLDILFNRHDFNPHNVPWDQSLTKRPEE